MGESRADLLSRFEREAVPLIGRVLRVAMKFTGSEGEAADLVQETYLRGMERFHQFRPGSNLLGWLNRIAYTQYVNRYHKQRLRRAEQLDEALDSPREPAFHPAPDLDEICGTVLLSARVRERVSDDMAGALDTLSIGCATCWCFAWLSYRDAAETLGVPIGTVMSRLSRLSRARLAMREELLRRMPVKDTPAARVGDRS